MDRILQVCQNLTNFWKRCSYGIIKDGELTNVSSAEYFDEHFRLLSPKKFQHYMGGICYDFVEFGDYYLSVHNIIFEKYYIYTNIPNGDTHTFIIVPFKDSYLYIEGAFKDLVCDGKSIRMFKSRLDIFKFITGHMFLANDNYSLKRFKYWVWKYGGHPTYGCDAETFTRYTTQTEPVYEGVAKNMSMLIKLQKSTSSDVSNIYKWTMDTIDKKWWNEDTYKLIKKDAWESIHKTRMVTLANKTIGMITAYKYTYNSEPGFWYIAEIYLIPEYRGKGIGRAILKNEISKHSKLLLQVNKTNLHAIKLYRSLGFEIVYENDESYEMILRKGV